MKMTLKRGLALTLLSAGLAWAAAAAPQKVELLNADGQVIATGALSGHLKATAALNTGRTLRISTTVNGVTTVKTFVLASPITASDPEAERLGVRVGDRVLPLETALEGTDTPSQAPAARSGADDSPNHDAGDDHGSGGHSAADGSGHDAGDDHGGSSGGSGSDDGSGHDAGDDHGDGGRGGSDDGGGHGGGHK